MKSFEIFQRMSDGNMDIRLAPLGNIIKINIFGQNGEVTFGVPREVAQDLMDEKEYVGGFLLADKGQFETLETHYADGPEPGAGDDDITDLDWMANNKVAELVIRGQSDNLVRSNLLSCVIALNCVAINHDGGQEMDIKANMEAARTLLEHLGYPVLGRRLP